MKKKKEKKIDHPHSAMAYTMVHPMAYPIMSLPGKEQRNNKEPGTTRNNKEVHF